MGIGIDPFRRSSLWVWLPAQPTKLEPSSVQIGAQVPKVAPSSGKPAESNAQKKQAEQNAALLAGVLEDNSDEVRKALKAKANPNVRGREGQTALMLAAKAGNLEILSMLIQAGAQVDDQVVPDGETALMLAVEYCHPEIVDELLLAHANPNLENRDGLRPLSRVLRRMQWPALVEIEDRKKSIAIALSLLRNGANPLAKKGGFSSTPLRLAANVGASPVVEEILKNSEVQDTDRWQAFFEAAEVGCVEVAQLLLVSLKDREPEKLHKNLTSALWDASLHGHTAMVTFLLRNNADPNGAEDSTMTPLAVAARGGYSEVLEVLLKAGADSERYEKDLDKRTPLHTVVRQGRLKCVEVLLENRANPNAKDAEGRTSLMFGVQKKNSEIVELLLKHKVEVNAQDEYGKTALMLAIESGDYQIILSLLAHGADPNFQTKEEKQTALMIALRTRGIDQKIVQSLLLAGANPNLGNENGTTPLMVAVSEGNIDLVSALLEKGADPNLKNKLGLTALMSAKLNKEVAIVEKLKQAGAQE